MFGEITIVCSELRHRGKNGNHKYNLRVEIGVSEHIWFHQIQVFGVKWSSKRNKTWSFTCYKGDQPDTTQKKAYTSMPRA